MAWTDDSDFDVGYVRRFFVSLGDDRKNSWLEAFWEHLLNAVNCCPKAFESGPFFTLKDGVEQMSWTLFKLPLVGCCLSLRCSPDHPYLCTLLSK